MNELNFQKFIAEMNSCASLVLDIKLALYDGDNSAAYKKLSLLNKKQLEISNFMIEQHFNPNYEFDFSEGSE